MLRISCKEYKRWFATICFCVPFLTGREREEGCTLPKLPLVIQKVSWIESVWRLPLILVKQYRGQIGNDGNSLVIENVSVNSYRCREKSVFNFHIREITLGMLYPSSWMALFVMWGRLSGAMLPNLWISWMTASVYGRLMRSSIVSGLDCPTTLSISAWTFSVHRERIWNIIFHV